MVTFNLSIVYSADNLTGFNKVKMIYFSSERSVGNLTGFREEGLTFNAYKYVCVIDSGFFKELNDMSCR
jgi:hypothetical protein